MKFNLTIIISIFVAIGLVVSCFTLVQVYQENHRLKTELEQRSNLLGEVLHESLAGPLSQETSDKIRQISLKFNQRQRIMGLAIFDIKDSLVSASPGVEPYIPLVRVTIGHVMDTDSSFG